MHKIETFISGLNNQVLKEEKRLQTEFVLPRAEVTEEKYYEMLGILPPEAMAGGAFLVGEPMDYGVGLGGKFGARYELYYEKDGKYYHGGLATISDFNSLVVKSI